MFSPDLQNPASPEAVTVKHRLIRTIEIEERYTRASIRPSQELLYSHNDFWSMFIVSGLDSDTRVRVRGRKASLPSCFRGN